MPFLSLKGISHAYLLKISITHNKTRIPFLKLLDDCISAKSISQILSIKDEHAFLFLNFLITGFCNSTADSLLDIFSFLIAPPDSFYQKIEARSLWYSSYLGYLAISNALSCNILYLKQKRAY